MCNYGWKPEPKPQMVQLKSMPWNLIKLFSDLAGSLSFNSGLRSFEVVTPSVSASLGTGKPGADVWWQPSCVASALVEQTHTTRVCVLADPQDEIIMCNYHVFHSTFLKWISQTNTSFKKELLNNGIILLCRSIDFSPRKCKYHMFETEKRANRLPGAVS